MRSPEQEILYKRAEKLEQLQATADRRLALLRDIQDISSFCPVCEEYYRFQSAAGEECRSPHADDCRLAKELADA